MLKSNFLLRSLSKPVVTAQRGLAPADLVWLAVVMFLWAICYPLIAVGLSHAPPLYFAALRSFVAGVGLLVPALALPKDWRVWVTLLGVGLSLTGMGFGGMFLAGGIVSSGLATVLANAQPLIAAGLAYVILNERLGPRRRVGLLLGFAGILLIALPSSGPENTNSSPLGVGYVLLGALGVASGNVLLKRLAGQMDMLMAIGWQFILGGLPLYVAAQFFEAPVQVMWNPAFVVVLLALGLLGTALALLLWFALLHRSELNRLNTFTFLTPAFALIIEAIFFNERLGLVEGGGIVLILLGLLWVSRR